MEDFRLQYSSNNESLCCLGPQILSSHSKLWERTFIRGWIESRRQMNKRLIQTCPLQEIDFVVAKFLPSTPVRSLISCIFETVGVFVPSPISNDDHYNFLLIFVLVNVLFQGVKHIEGLWFSGVVHQNVAVSKAKVVSSQLLIVWIAMRQF